MVKKREAGKDEKVRLLLHWSSLKRLGYMVTGGAIQVKAF